MPKICKVEGCLRRHHCHGKCRYHNYHDNPTITCALCGQKEKTTYKSLGRIMQWCSHCHIWETTDSFKLKKYEKVKKVSRDGSAFED